MNLIVQAVLRIFEAIFERDARNRAPVRGEEADQAQKAQKGPSQPSLLTQILRELELVEKPKPKPRKKRIRPASKLRSESLSEHLTRLEREQPRRGGPKARAPTRRSGRKTFRVPGETPLEQLMYAQIILGPCKANAGRRRPLP
jgi:hypothetical protein